MKYELFVMFNIVVTKNMENKKKYFNRRSHAIFSILNFQLE